MGLEINKWYYSKRGHLCRVDEILDDGNLVVTSHFTGNRLAIPPYQAKFFTPAKKPNTEPGTAIIRQAFKVCKDAEGHEFDNLYEKYKNIIPGSIYRVQSTSGPTVEKLVKTEGKLRLKTTKVASKGCTRCKVTCIMCGGERDIKVQDAHIVKYCEQCCKTQKKNNLKKFLAKRKAMKDGKVKGYSK